MPSNLVLAYVAQELQSSERAAIEFVLDGDTQLRGVEQALSAAEAANDGDRLGELHAQYAGIGGYDARARAGQLMHGLGFASDDEPRPLSTFSGGWRVRLNVAQALMCRSDLLLLDEPTNHLDLDAIQWLENWLLEYPGTLLLISHDREFLDRVTNRIVNIEQRTARAYQGNYTAFETQRAAALAQQAALLLRQQREVAHMEAFIQRFRAQASKARQAQSRMKALERMQRIAPAHVDSPFQFQFAAPAKLPRPLLVLEEVAVGYGSQPLLTELNLKLAPGDRIGLLGRNGAGKSTAMKLLAGVLAPLEGQRIEAPDLRIGYLAQHQLEQLHAGLTPFEHLRDCDDALRLRAATERPRAREQELRDFLAAFGFRGDRVFEAVAPFSGGEKARLVLALIAYQRPNLLLLDEPTNHLDLEMRQALALALQDYEGAVVFVSHDRHLLRVVANELVLVQGGKMRPFDGDIEDYAALLSTISPTLAENVGADAVTTTKSRRQSRRDQAQARQALSPLRAEVAGHERELERLEARRQELDAALVDPALFTLENKRRLAELTAERGRLGQQIAAVEAAWMRTAGELESLAALRQDID